MTGRGNPGGRKTLLAPIHFIFKLLQQRSTVSIWLYEQLGMRIEGKIRGFDEFMNLVIDDAVEVKQSTKSDPNPQDGPNGGRRELGMYNYWKRKELLELELTYFTGQILLKGDNVALIQALE